MRHYASPRGRVRRDQGRQTPSRSCPSRGYSCEKDERIWKDFDGMVLNEEWLAELEDESRPRVVRALMHPAESLVRRIGRDSKREPT